MPTVLVTGGDGAFGKLVTIQLRSRGYDVICGSRRASADAEFCQLDVTDAASVSNVIRSVKPSIIVHLAATFVSDYDEAYATNVAAARNILTAVQEAGQQIRVLLAGSAAEYGLISSDENPVKVDQILRPVSIYGLTKSWQTNYGLMCAHQGLDVVVARIFNLDGVGLSDRLFVGRINRQIEEVLSGDRDRIEVGPLSAVRDYLPMNEAAVQLVAIAERGSPGEIYHVASGEPIRMRDFLNRRLTSVGISHEIVDEAPALSSRVGYDVPVIYADISRTIALLDE